jgi:hypothetical protein
MRAAGEMGYSPDLVPLYVMFSDFVLSSSYVMDLVWVVLL